MRGSVFTRDQLLPSIAYRKKEMMKDMLTRCTAIIVWLIGLLVLFPLDRYILYKCMTCHEPTEILQLVNRRAAVAMLGAAAAMQGEGVAMQGVEEMVIPSGGPLLRQVPSSYIHVLLAHVTLPLYDSCLATRHES